MGYDYEIIIVWNQIFAVKLARSLDWPALITSVRCCVQLAYGVVRLGGFDLI